MFNKITGNEYIKTVFRRMLKNQKIPNSLLFAGEEGVGKREFALEVAKAFVCQNSSGGEACDKCRACLRASKFNFPKSDDRDGHKKVIFSEHPDIGQVIPYNKNILVDAVRELESESNFLPYEAKARFFLINDAEKMNEAAANALLKTLEEPSKTSHIFLVTSRPAALLPTIRSRCQIVRFSPLQAKEIEDYLFQTKKYDHADSELLSNLAKGSIGRALSMDLGKYREHRETMIRSLESLINTHNLAALLKTSEEINDAKNKDAYEDFLSILQTLIHDVWTLRLGREQITNVDIKLRLVTLAKDAHLNKLASWLTEIETLRENLSVNLNKKIATDALFMKMSSN